MGYDPEAFGRRVKDEVTARGWDVQTLQQKLARATYVRGTSYGAVWGYVNGKAPAREPRRAVVEAMARLFSTPGATVRPEYLLYGGVRTKEMAAMKGHLQSTRERHEEERSSHVAEEVIDAHPALRDLGYEVHAVLLAYVQAWVRERASEGKPVEIGDAVAHAEAVAEWALAPLGTAEGEDAFPPASADLSAYMVAVLNARTLLLRVRQRLATTQTKEGTTSGRTDNGEGDKRAQKEVVGGRRAARREGQDR